MQFIDSLHIPTKAFAKLPSREILPGPLRGSYRTEAKWAIFSDRVRAITLSRWMSMVVVTGLAVGGLFGPCWLGPGAQTLSTRDLSTYV